MELTESGNLFLVLYLIYGMGKILNLEGHLNHITGSRVTAILLNGLILLIGGASAVEGLLSTGPTPSSG